MLPFWLPLTFCPRNGHLPLLAMLAEVFQPRLPSSISWEVELRFVVPCWVIPIFVPPMVDRRQELPITRPAPVVPPQTGTRMIGARQFTSVRERRYSIRRITRHLTMIRPVFLIPFRREWTSPAFAQSRAFTITRGPVVLRCPMGPLIATAQGAYPAPKTLLIVWPQQIVAGGSKRLTLGALGVALQFG